MADEERTALIVLGREIGTYDGWDGGEEVIQFHSFQPNDAFRDEFPEAFDDETLNVDWIEGKFQFYNDEGDVIWDADIVIVLFGSARYDADSGDGSGADVQAMSAEYGCGAGGITSANIWPTQDQTHGNPVTGKKEPWPDITRADVAKAHADLRATPDAFARDPENPSPMGGSQASENKKLDWSK